MKPLETAPVDAPLAYLLAGLLIGLPLAGALQAPPKILLFLSLAILLRASRKTGTRQWYALFLLAATLAAWAYGELRLPAPPDETALRLPRREARLELEIRRIYQERDRYGKTSGLATVRAAPWESRLRTGNRIYFRFSPGNGTRGFYVGQRLRCRGLLKPVPEDPEGSRSFASYLRSIGVYHRFERNGKIEWMGEPPRAQVFYRGMNERIREGLRLGAPAEKQLAGVYAAMLLGRKSELGRKQKEAYKSTGTMHFFAISGLHIGVIAMTLGQALRLLRTPGWLAPWIGLSALFLYVGITGASPSSVRAFLMTAFYWVAFACRRQRSPFASLTGSAVLVLCVLPEQLWSVGFQLSYAVVASILLFGLPLNRRLTRMLRPYQWLPEGSWTWRQRCIDRCVTSVCLLFSISLSAWLAGAPFSAAYFGIVAPGAVVLNMLLVNLASLVIVGGVLSIGASLLHLEPVAAFINHAAWVNIALMEALIDGFSRVPGAFIECGEFPKAWAYAATALYFALLLRPHLRARRPTG